MDLGEAASRDLAVVDTGHRVLVGQGAVLCSRVGYQTAVAAGLVAAVDGRKQGDHAVGPAGCRTFWWTRVAFTARSQHAAELGIENRFYMQAESSRTLSAFTCS